MDGAGGAGAGGACSGRTLVKVVLMRASASMRPPGPACSVSGPSLGFSAISSSSCGTRAHIMARYSCARRRAHTSWPATAALGGARGARGEDLRGARHDLGVEELEQRHLARQRDETCPISTEGWTRRVHFVREGGGGALQRAAARRCARPAPRARPSAPARPPRRRGCGTGGWCAGWSAPGEARPRGGARSPTRAR